MKNYTTKENVENYLGQDIDDNIDLYLKAGEKLIENYTKRSFIIEEGIKLYNGNHKNELLIDPAIEITKIEVDGVEKDFITYPYNSLPIIKLILKHDRFTSDYKNVSVTGKWGWSECVPDDIKMVATELVAKMYQGQIKVDITAERIGDYNVNYKTESEVDLTSIKAVLDKYKMLV